MNRTNVRLWLALATLAATPWRFAIPALAAQTSRSPGIVHLAPVPSHRLQADTDGNRLFADLEVQLGDSRSTQGVDVIVRYKQGQEPAQIASVGRGARRLSLDRSVAVHLTRDEIRRLAASDAVESVEVDAICHATRARLLPIAWVYPLGKQQEQRAVRAPQYYHWAEVIAGDGHMITRFLPDRLEGQTVITNTVRQRHLELFRQCGVGRLITTTPEFDGQSFGTNVMEGVLCALAGKHPSEVQPSEYLDLLRQLGWRPRVQELQPKA